MILSGHSAERSIAVFEELTVWLQVWYSTLDKPIVVQPSLHLFEVLKDIDIVDDDSRRTQLFFIQHFVCDDVDQGRLPRKGGMLELCADLYRKSFSTLGMNGPRVVSLVLQGFVDDCRGFLTSGYLSKLTSVCA